MSKPKLIVVDDEKDMGSMICDIAEEAGFDSMQYICADEFRDNYNASADVIILDLIMPGTDGIELIRFLSDIKCEAAIILTSGFDPGVLHSAQKLAQEHGLNYVGRLKKPFRMDELHQLITHIPSISEKSCNRTYLQPPLPEELRDALDNDELVVHYQPQVSLKDRTIVGVEALVRWQHPVHGLLTPDMFISTAEEHGMIDDLTWVVLEQAISQSRECFTNDEIHIAVNMSAGTFRNLDLPEFISGLANQHGMDPSHLILEVTESVSMWELVKSLDILTRLRMKGFRLSIDDFGTGYSSMIQLHRGPFSEIKIDRSFVMEMTSDTEAEAIVETIIMLGHKLGMNVIAEGVETQAAWDRLNALGCDDIQGYFIAKPMPMDELKHWVSDW